MVRALLQRSLVPAKLTTSLALLLTASACYTGASVERDINKAWKGRQVAQIETSWGKSEIVASAPGVDTHAWKYVSRRFSLPSGSANLSVEGNAFEFNAQLRPGSITRYTTQVVADVQAGVITDVRGPSLRWGPPNDANIHWGFLLGAHVGMGRLDDTSTPLPSGGLYIGGMLSRQLALVGSFSMVSGIDDEGGAMGFSWALSPQYWVSTRVWLRAGPAAILAFDPGFENVGFDLGVAAGASYAVIKSGTFALDLRADLTGGSDVAFGSLGIGVNLN